MSIFRPVHGVSVLCIAFAASTATASNTYVLDDGVPESALSYGLPADYCWFQSFTTVGSVDSITSVQVMFQPGSIPAGTLITLAIWDDPNEDGDPSDAFLVGTRGAVVPNVAGLAYTSYSLPSPALVHGVFFVGAYLTTDGSFGSISLLDYGSGLSGRAYFATEAPGSFSPALLSSSFYNHIEVLGAGIHGVFMLRAEGSGNAPVTYCVAKLNSQGCTPQIGSLGVPSVSSGTGFFVQASSVLNRSPGALIYGTTGRASTAFQGGTLCIAAPLHRTPVHGSGGSLAGVDCTGVYSFDFAAWIASGADPSLVAGTTVNAQFYSRDQGYQAPNNSGLTNAIEFTLVP